MSLGFEVCLSDERMNNAPRCGHGPTILFEKYDEVGQKARKFFACSACRDRKLCSFFQWADEDLSVERHKVWQQIYAKNAHCASVQELKTKLRAVRKYPAEDRRYCHSCSELLLSTQQSHDAHVVETPLSDNMLLNPSLFLKPLEANSKNAQYLFSDRTADFFASMFKLMGFERIVCIGAPRVHELAMRENLASILLDIDTRYRQFFPGNFLHYNMFNHHFFGGLTDEEKLNNFLKQPSVAVFIDPPFGGFVEILANTVAKIQTVGKAGSLNGPAVFWIFPYFMENRIKEYSPELKMLDYKVTYANHSKYKTSAKGRGSPARLFTNLSPAQVVLPQEEGYRFCKACDRFSYKENIHCKKCGSCTSKDGSQYKHCDECSRCVKPSRVHCFACGLCELQDHICGEVKGHGCHICGSLGHKRRQCPKRSETMPQRKSMKRKGKSVGDLRKEETEGSRGKKCRKLRKA